MRLATRLSLSAAGVALALVLLSGCGSSPEESKAAATARRNALAQSPDAYLVSAVKAASSDAPLSLRFELQQQPKVGAEFGLRLRIESAEALDSLQVRYEVPDGLAWVGAEPAVREAKVPVDAKMDRSARMRALRAGVYELRAVAAAEASPGQGRTATFSIPVIVD